jgi:phenylpropionate dioxygenase-like ring-hydroxylating dioxygenase large terminal subunit
MISASTTPCRSNVFLDDDQLIDRVLAHIDNGTTDLSDETWTEPIENYRSDDRLQRERLVLRRLPAPFCPSAAIPEPGSFVSRDAAGIALVAVRDRENVVRVFKNSCRHRGTAVVSGSGCAASLSCPFHGWTYRLDGTLRHVPDSYGFPDLDIEAHGLVEVRSVERDGFVVVDQEGGCDLAPLEMPAILGDELVLIGSNEDRVEANWKVLLEGFLEGYHIKATHRTTFLPYGYDNLNVVEYDGPHSRVTFPFRRIEKLRDQPASERQIAGAVTRVYCIFPNVIVAELSRHIIVVVLEPLSASTTNFVTYALGPADAKDDRTSAAAKDISFVQQGGVEDRQMALAVQRGMATGANTHALFGRFEGALTHFHRNLHALV